MTKIESDLQKYLKKIRHLKGMGCDYKGRTESQKRDEERILESSTDDDD
jgi:hypothetical protein